MGFDLIIVQKLHFDKDSGLPFVYSKNGGRVSYEPDLFKIPQPFSRLVSQRGHHWHEYIKAYNKDWEYETSVDDFLAHFPLWSVVYEGLEDDYSWTEKDHDLFKAALLWLSEKGGFYVSWSY